MPPRPRPKPAFLDPVQITHREPTITHAEPAPIETRAAQPISHDGKCPRCKSLLSRFVRSELEPGKPGHLREYRTCKSCLAPFVVPVRK